MLFRRDSSLRSSQSQQWPSERDKLLVALIVVESPVLGPNMQQLEGALRFARQITTATHEWQSEPLCPLTAIAEDTHDVRILGPFFSGSARAYRSALATYPSEVFMVTGTATSPGVDKVPADAVEFQRVVPTDEKLSQWVKDNLGQRLSERLFDWPEKWRLISGPSQVKPARSPTPRDGRAPFLASLAETGTFYGQAVDSADDGETDYRFPLHISEIRAEREVMQAQQADLFPSIRRTLGLKLNPDEEQESDIPATLSSLTPYDDDLTLG